LRPRNQRVVRRRMQEPDGRREAAAHCGAAIATSTPRAAARPSPARARQAPSARGTAHRCRAETRHPPPPAPADRKNNELYRSSAQRKFSFQKFLQRQRQGRYGFGAEVNIAERALRPCLDWRVRAAPTGRKVWLTGTCRVAAC
jgi:hypothetical protein